MMDEEDGNPPDAPGWEPGGPMWASLNSLLRRSGPLSPNLNPGNADATQSFLRSEDAHILIIGAGGLGCELLKNVALSGFRFIDVIDLDTIDVTNLNRQFLFRAGDVGKPKATVAADFLNTRIPGVRVTPHHANIMDFGADFYRQFSFIISGLDSIDARRWLNATLVDMVEFDADGNVDQMTVKPLIDGGTEGFQGQARVIYPRINACFECVLNLFPPSTNFPLCTIANTPRLPEHCVEYANVVLWPRENPFGDDVKLDVDNPAHITWLFETAKKRADEFGITGVTYRLTQGVAKHIIPAVASTNAIVAAACANEAVKLITYVASNIDNFSMYNGTKGAYTLTYRNERRDDCPVCGTPAPLDMLVNPESSLAEFVADIAGNAELRSRKPFLRTKGGKTLYASHPPALEKSTRCNLERAMKDLVSPDDNILSLNDRDLTFARTLVVSFRG